MGRLLLVLIIFGLIGYGISRFIYIPVRNISVSGNNNLSDIEVIRLAKLDDNPSFIGNISYVVKKRLEDSFYIENAKVSKGLLSINIKITESKILYVDSKSGKKISLNGSVKDDKEVCVPTLINDIPSDKVAYFKKNMNRIDENVLCKMSEIKYDPNDIDKDRYFVYMDDGNNVYLTVNKLKKINNYDTILESIGKQNGTLYLDYGNYFETK